MKIRRTNIFYFGPYTDKLHTLLTIARSKKYSVPQLARIFSCSKNAIFNALKQNEIYVPNLGKFSRRYNLNDSFFDNLNSESAYWLGFIAADGTLSSRDECIRIGLNQKDDQHLKKFLKAVQCHKKLYYVSSNNSVSVEIYSKQMVKRLNELGITSRKSLSISKVDIPDVYMSHFIRGVYDGDGSLTGRKRTHIQFIIAGNKPFLEQIQNTVINKCLVRKTKIYPMASKAYKLQYTGIQSMKILDYLYRDSKEKIRLTRKYLKYKKYKNKYN